MFSKIVFVGPQGVGKTTQAALLSNLLQRKGIKFMIKSYTHYTIFHRICFRLTTHIARLLGRTMTLRFYPNESPILSPAPDFFRIFFPLMVYIHIVSMVFDSTLFKFSRKPFIECEGFIFKQIADLYYLAYLFSLLGSRSLKIFVRLALALIQNLDFIVVCFQIWDYKALFHRYVKQNLKDSWRKIEPWDYVILQEAIYKVIVKGYFINAQRPPEDIFRDLTKCLGLQHSS